MVGCCGFVVAAGLGAWAAGECSEEWRSVACVVGVIALVTRVSGIGRVCLAINTVGCLGAARIIKSGCVAGASLVFFFFFFFFFFSC